MKLKAMVKQAAADPRKAGRLLDALKFGQLKFKGQPVYFDYNDLAKLFNRCAGLDRASFEALVIESEAYEYIDRQWT